MSCIDRSKVFTPKNFPGSKSMPSTKYGVGSGKMSSAHGVTTKGATKGMKNASGRIGASTRSFGPGKQGPCNIGSKKGGY